MKTVWRYSILPGQEIEQLWASSSKIVHVASRGGGEESVDFWLEHSPSMAGVGRRVRLRIFGTGQPIDDARWTHVGTAIAGPFVWHLYAYYH